MQWALCLARLLRGVAGGGRPGQWTPLCSTRSYWPVVRCGGRAKRRSVPDLAERLFVASEKQISTKLSVKEVLMSLSSKGKCF